MSYENNCYKFFSPSNDKNEFRLNVIEFLTMFFGTAAIELILAFSWQAPDNSLMEGWLEESLVSSGVCALYITFASTALRAMKYECWSEVVENKTQTNKPSHFYCHTFLTQMISGALAFGIGLGADATMDYLMSNNTNATSGREYATPTAVPIFETLTVVGIKVLSRYGIFRFIDCAKNALSKDSEEENALVDISDDRKNRSEHS